jgi:SAM-dependent methyltransferase
MFGPQEIAHRQADLIRMNINQLYDRKFYERFDDESSQSAVVIAPLILDLLRPGSLVDVGCGIGQWLEAFAGLGVEDYLGVDGPHVCPEQSRIPSSRFRRHDLSVELPDLGRRFDLALSVEVGEHLGAARAEAFVCFLTGLAPAVVFSAAVPRQGGFGHVNEQWPWYWRELFARRGYIRLDPWRRVLWDHPQVAYYYQQNLFLYVDPAVHQDIVARVGVPDKYRELTLVKTSILQDLSGPGPLGRAYRRVRVGLEALKGRRRRPWVGGR